MKRKLYFLLILSGVLLSLGWFKWASGLVMLVAFVPLLFVDDYLYNNKDKYRSVKAFNYSFITFFVWNALSLWWICNSTVFGGIAIIIYNAFLMSLVFWLYHIVKRKIGNAYSYIALFAFWIGFEYYYFNAEISFAGLALGNGFANDVKLIQWYEYTGVLGGSLWILIVNVLIFLTVKKYLSISHINKSIIYRLISVFLIIFIPIAISVYIYYSYEEKKNPCNIVVLQPNIDPYNEKYDGSLERQQLGDLLFMADSLADDSVDYFIGPETALPKGIWQSKLKKESDIIRLKQFVRKYPKSKFILGLSSYKLFNEGEKISTTARKFSGVNKYYDAFNTAIQIDTSQNIQLYHKSKLVVGVEKMPFPKLFGFLESFAIDMGGIVGSLGTQKDRSVFTSPSDGTRIAPVICYESIYGEYVTKYIKNGANFIFIITNDGWWGNTAGYKIHLSLSRLRAIETRRSVARSANTGISCFVNQRGDLIKSTSWWKKDVIKSTLNANDEITFYVKHGDFIGRIAAVISILLLIYNAFLYVKNGRTKIFSKAKRI
ncbi:MAG: apolipoprotein N-acyltransferase [Bacteroidetes bacterium]|nr:apolipoprotein N-acyltransferase [Bacteroidota bacterium]